MRVRLDVDYYGLLGDAEHFQSELKVANFFRLTDGVILGNFIEGGYIHPIKDVKINDRFFINGDRLRGFKNLGVGPRDSSTTDALGGEIYYLSRNEVTFPLGLPEDLGVGGLLFADIGTLYGLSESGAGVLDENKPRASAGVGISWLSPFGPVKFYLSKAILKENYDKKEIFRFSFGTTY
jgi:outer membrane protein insertion porin family